MANGLVIRITELAEAGCNTQAPGPSIADLHIDPEASLVDARFDDCTSVVRYGVNTAFRFQLDYRYLLSILKDGSAARELAVRRESGMAWVPEAKTLLVDVAGSLADLRVSELPDNPRDLPGLVRRARLVGQMRAAGARSWLFG